MCVHIGADGKQCNEPADPICKTWGIGGGFCKKHIGLTRARMYSKAFVKTYSTDARDAMAEPEAGPEGSYVEDYIKIYALLMDKEHCRQLMTELQSEIVGGFWKRSPAPNDERFKRPNRETEDKYVRLSRVLEYYEGLCWFPVTRRLYTGSLTSANYVGSLALGYMPKDAGAGAKHGEYSHRLQWHLIMRVVTQGFKTAPYRSGWSHSPLDLFTHLGSAWPQAQGIWGFVCDDGGGMAYNNPAVLNMDLCGGFEVNGMHSEKTAEQWRKGNMMLCAAANRRTVKRLHVLETAEALLHKHHKGAPGLLYIGNVVGLVEKWKKVGKPPRLPPEAGAVAAWSPDKLVDAKYWATSGGPAAHAALLDVAHRVWDVLVASGSISERNNGYAQDPTEANALLPVNVEPMTPQLIADRVAKSNKESFDPTYAYCTGQGAYRR